MPVFIKQCHSLGSKKTRHQMSVQTTFKNQAIVNLKNKRAMMALGRSPEYQWNQIISKSVHQFSRRSRLKLFSIYSPGGHFVQKSGTV